MYGYLKLLLSGIFSWFVVWAHLLALVSFLLQGVWMISWFCFAAAWFAFDATRLRKIYEIKDS